MTKEQEKEQFQLRWKAIQVVVRLKLLVVVASVRQFPLKMIYNVFLIVGWGSDKWEGEPMSSERDSPIYFQTKPPFYEQTGIHINSGLIWRQWGFPSHLTLIHPPFKRKYFLRI